MMNRVDIIQSASMLLRSAKVPNYTAVGRLAGCHRAAISHIVRGKNAATDKMMLSLGDGLRDLSLRAERLADAIDREVITNSRQSPPPSLRQRNRARDDLGRFVPNGDAA